MLSFIAMTNGADSSKWILEAVFDRNDTLTQIQWFSVGIYPVVINSQKARDFAQLPEVNLMTSRVKVNRNHPQFIRLNRVLRSPPNIQISPYAFAAYDSVQILGTALEQSRIDIALLSCSTFPDLRHNITSAIHNAANDYEGLISSGALDENGDLASSNYELWQVREDNWVRVIRETDDSGAGGTLFVGSIGDWCIVYFQPDELIPIPPSKHDLLMVIFRRRNWYD